MTTKSWWQKYKNNSLTRITEKSKSSDLKIIFARERPFILNFYLRCTNATDLKKTDQSINQSINQSFICHIFSNILNLLHYLVPEDLWSDLLTQNHFTPPAGSQGVHITRTALNWVFLSPDRGCVVHFLTSLPNFSPKYSISIPYFRTRAKIWYPISDLQIPDINQNVLLNRC